jgi:hypothetical protein
LDQWEENNGWIHRKRIMGGYALSSDLAQSLEEDTGWINGKRIMAGSIGKG